MYSVDSIAALFNVDVKKIVSLDKKYNDLFCLYTGNDYGRKKV